MLLVTLPLSAVQVHAISLGCGLQRVARNKVDLVNPIGDRNGPRWVQMFGPDQLYEAITLLVRRSATIAISTVGLVILGPAEGQTAGLGSVHLTNVIDKTCRNVELIV